MGSPGTVSRSASCVSTSKEVTAAWKERFNGKRRHYNLYLLFVSSCCWLSKATTARAPSACLYDFGDPLSVKDNAREMSDVCDLAEDENTAASLTADRRRGAPFPRRITFYYHSAERQLKDIRLQIRGVSVYALREGSERWLCGESSLATCSIR